MTCRGRDAAGLEACDALLFEGEAEMQNRKTRGGSVVLSNSLTGRRRIVRSAATAAAALLACAVAPRATFGATGTWNPTGFTGANGGGLWSDTTRWTSGIVADGAGSLADFGTLNISADTTVNLDTPRTIGQLRFIDTTSSFFNWTLGNNSDNNNVLTLNNGTAQPTITIGNGTNTGQLTTINAVLAGTNGFVKTGQGRLQLSAANTFSGQ